MNRTIRELGGEIAAELEMAIQAAERQGDSTFAGFNWRARQKVVELMIGVLARHTGKLIQNDEDFPVEPLPKPPRPGDDL